MTDDELEDEVMERIAILMEDDPGPAPQEIIEQAWGEVRGRDDSACRSRGQLGIEFSETRG